MGKWYFSNFCVICNVGKERGEFFVSMLSRGRNRALDSDGS